MKNLLREKIMNGEKTVGTFFEAGNASVAEALALTDLDYMLIDTEHGPFDVESVMLMLRGAELHGTTALVRVKDSNRNSILKMLDIGALFRRYILLRKLKRLWNTENISR